MTANLTSPDSSPSLISPSISPQQSVDSLPTTSPLKLGVMASGSGSNFEAIASAIANGQLNAQISVLIYNNPGIKALARAEKYGIPAVLHNHRHTKKREDFDQQIVETLRQYEVEWVVMAGWMRVVTQVLLDAFPNRILNIHPSLLPTFKGVRAVEQALEAGVKITGCTVHVVSLDVDSGPILFQAAVPVLPDDTPETLHARIQVQEHRILVEAIALINC
ncbi:MAG: phosphoribosylglycinamide formyltransferase [Moorea sp. SIO4G2]|uniref:phosphoribosylglycinamide formyltransferase n=1 Tax=Moorena sp. SIO3I6 TaxID=2607831 RepID=UPI0013F7AA1E|nr:phosphoribosylglycinamide formyltransferase [Moorena sp. SIO3I6]NEO60125.1 phosphoribosylglycinamide formyltransferase [Moorena sp. SIO4G2]NEP23562.1 phosphoribosylglycinamide formyltransferase [Moorena sp. SIO3I6]